MLIVWAVDGRETLIKPIAVTRNRSLQRLATAVAHAQPAPQQRLMRFGYRGGCNKFLSGAEGTMYLFELCKTVLFGMRSMSEDFALAKLSNPGRRTTASLTPDGASWHLVNLSSF
jgi:hypothetical protein